VKETSKSLEISKELKRKNVSLIVVDGVDGSGKSTLAGKIAKDLSCLHINLDDYLEKKRGSFVKYIKYNLLKNEIDGANISIIIEGVCVLAVLRNLNINSDFLIYIKRMSNYGLWLDEDLCDVDEDIDDFIENQNLEHLKFCEANATIEGKEFDPKNCNIPKLTEEIIRYHFEFRPQEIADIIFKRID